LLAEDVVLSSLKNVTSLCKPEACKEFGGTEHEGVILSPLENCALPIPSIQLNSIEDGLELWSSKFKPLELLLLLFTCTSRKGKRPCGGGKTKEQQVLESVGTSTAPWLHTMVAMLIQTVTWTIKGDTIYIITLTALYQAGTYIVYQTKRTPTFDCFM
jgi:hypothetical protein